MIPDFKVAPSWMIWALPFPPSFKAPEIIMASLLSWTARCCCSQLVIVPLAIGLQLWEPDSFLTIAENSAEEIESLETGDLVFAKYSIIAAFITLWGSSRENCRVPCLVWASDRRIAACLRPDLAASLAAAFLAGVASGCSLAWACAAAVLYLGAACVSGLGAGVGAACNLLTVFLHAEPQDLPAPGPDANVGPCCGGRGEITM